MDEKHKALKKEEEEWRKKLGMKQLRSDDVEKKGAEQQQEEKELEKRLGEVKAQWDGKKREEEEWKAKEETEKEKEEALKKEEEKLRRLMRDARDGGETVEEDEEIVALRQQINKTTKEQDQVLCTANAATSNHP